MGYSFYEYGMRLSDLERIYKQAWMRAWCIAEQVPKLEIQSQMDKDCKAYLQNYYDAENPKAKVRKTQPLYLSEIVKPPKKKWWPRS